MCGDANEIPLWEVVGSDMDHDEIMAGKPQAETTMLNVSLTAIAVAAALSGTAFAMKPLSVVEAMKLLTPAQRNCLRQVAIKNANQKPNYPPEEAYVPKECKIGGSAAKQGAAELYYSDNWYKAYNANVRRRQ